jgi:hypothetical protein
MQSRLLNDSSRRQPLYRSTAERVDQASAQALADFAASKGSVVQVTRLRAVVDGRAVSLSLSRPVRVRVLDTPRDLLLERSCKDLVTPTWNVALLERHPDVPAGARLSVHPRSYGSDGRLRQGDVCRAQDARATGTVGRLLAAVAKPLLAVA